MHLSNLLKAAIFAGALTVAACNSSPDQSADGATENNGPALDVHRPFVSGNGSVNSYWLEGEDEILVFDSQGRRDLALRIVSQIEETGKPVSAIVISHYHPDHFGGLAVFAEAFPDAEIIMAEEVADQIGRDLSGYVEQLRERDGDDFESLPAPDRIIENGDEIEISGVTLTFHIVPEAEAAPITMLSIASQKILLASDLVVNGMHPNLADADLDSWPRALERATRDFTGFTLYPGHGEPGPINLLVANQTGYLNFMRNLTQNEILQDNVASEEEVGNAIATIREHYAGWDSATGRPAQLRRNLEALVAQFGGRLDTRRANTDNASNSAAD